MGWPVDRTCNLEWLDNDELPRYARSLDAITALIERELPGLERSSSSYRGRYQARIYKPGYPLPILGDAATEPLARCAAFARAVASLPAKSEKDNP